MTPIVSLATSKGLSIEEGNLGCIQQLWHQSKANYKWIEFVFKMQRINKYSSNKRITWHINPSAAPHMGGTWQRIIRTVKNVMLSMIKNAVLTDFQLMTVFTEIEAIINNRPLTYVSDNPYDFELLTPNHVLLGRYNRGAVLEENDGNISSRRRWKQVVAIANQFWKRRLIGYLLTLQSRGKWNVHKTNIEPGTIEILKKENLPREKWPLARIIDACPSSDRIIRVVKVKTMTGEYVRPAMKIFLLECDNNFKVPQGEGC